MNPYEFSELVADLFRAKGYKRIFSNPRVAHQFFDIEMYLDDKKVLISCQLNAHRTPIT
ncbi:MAG TPA: restriction endonuclease, partial [Firmicutes bacterium]|nr:restriction endonuclease [Bacillota bacterium]